MKISVDISLYPLKDEYIPTIKEFIDALNKDDQVEVFTNSMSTQLFGEYDQVMNLLSLAMKASFEKWGKQIFVTKFLLGNTREATGIK